MHYGNPRKRRERQKGPNSISEDIMIKNFPNLRKDMDIQIQEA